MYLVLLGLLPCALKRENELLTEKCIRLRQDCVTTVLGAAALPIAGIKGPNASIFKNQLEATKAAQVKTLARMMLCTF